MGCVGAAKNLGGNSGVAVTGGGPGSGRVNRRQVRHRFQGNNLPHQPPPRHEHAGAFARQLGQFPHPQQAASKAQSGLSGKSSSDAAIRWQNPPRQQEAQSQFREQVRDQVAQPVKEATAHTIARQKFLPPFIRTR